MSMTEKNNSLQTHTFCNTFNTAVQPSDRDSSDAQAKKNGTAKTAKEPGERTDCANPLYHGRFKSSSGKSQGKQSNSVPVD
jgi:hypothetical protein